jgi:hypothetical protein
MAETADRFGLKKHFLRKHLALVDRFYRNLDKVNYQSEAAIRCKARFEKNKNKLLRSSITMEFLGITTTLNTRLKRSQD